MRKAEFTVDNIEPMRSATPLIKIPKTIIDTYTDAHENISQVILHEATASTIAASMSFSLSVLK